jgi:hypothetical protein
VADSTLLQRLKIPKEKIISERNDGVRCPFSMRSALLRASLRRKGRTFLFAYPALIPHPGTPGLGNVTGLLPAVPLRRDWSTVGLKLCLLMD